MEAPPTSIAPRSTNFLGLDFDGFDTIALVRQMQEAERIPGFKYLVTPNVDHMIRLTGPVGRRDDSLWSAYRIATWCVCDSRVLKRVAALKGVELALAPGSDLTARLFERVISPGDVIAIVGSHERTIELLKERFPGTRFLQHIPPMGMRSNPAAMAEAAMFIANAGARFTFIAVGSPQQELLAAQAAELIPPGGTALCVGAAIEFVVGIERRAPPVVQRLGLEWAHRLLANPKRLWRRYFLEGPRIFWRAAVWSKRIASPPQDDLR